MLIYFGQFSFAQTSSNYYENIDKDKSAFDKNDYKIRPLVETENPKH